MALRGAVILGSVSAVVIHLTNLFPFCGVMSGVQCNTSAVVCIPNLSGTGPMAQKSGLPWVNKVYNTKTFGQGDKRPGAFSTMLTIFGAVGTEKTS